MLLDILVAGGVLFFVVTGWVLITRWASRSDAGAASCNLPRHECGHCPMADSCALRDDAEEAADRPDQR